MVQVEVWSAGACNSRPGGQSVEERPSWLQQAAVATASASGGWPEQRLHAGSGCHTQLPCRPAASPAACTCDWYSPIEGCCRPAWLAAWLAGRVGWSSVVCKMPFACSRRQGVAGGIVWIESPCHSSPNILLPRGQMTNHNTPSPSHRLSTHHSGNTHV